MWTVMLMACRPDEPAGSDATDTEPTGAPHSDVLTTDSGTVPHSELDPPAVGVSCGPTANPLVFECTVTLATPGPATLSFSAPGADPRTFTDDQELDTHTFTGWGLLPETTYDVTSGGSATTVTTLALPPELQSIDITTTGALFGIDAVLVYVKCGHFVMVDGQGRIVWYLPTNLYNSFSDGMRWSQTDRTVLAVTDSTMSPGPSEVGEYDLAWNERLHLAPGDFTLKLTHDADKWGQYTYLLGETAGRLGGFEVFDGTTHLGTWMLDDGFPNTPNLANAHVNGLSVSATGEVVISALNLDSAIAVDGDPASPTFLQVLWHASGRVSSPLPDPDFAPTSGVVFDAQHNASRVGDELWVFDNGSRSSARAVRLQMDLVTGALTELDSWSTGSVCRNQGGALPVAGGALVTCANSDEVALFRDATSAPDWTMLARCGGAPPGSGSTRAYPVVIE